MQVKKKHNETLHECGYFVNHALELWKTGGSAGDFDTEGEVLPRPHRGPEVCRHSPLLRAWGAFHYGHRSRVSSLDYVAASFRTKIFRMVCIWAPDVSSPYDRQGTAWRDPWGRDTNHYLEAQEERLEAENRGDYGPNHEDGQESTPNEEVIMQPSM